MTPFPKYPNYKDSGVEWLGEVPEHWEANRVFSIFNERVETGYSQLPILNITISNGVKVEQFEGERKKRLIEDRDAYKRAAAGDIAYNTMRMWQGAVGDVPVDGLVSPAYVVARPIKDINSRYYSFLFRGQTFQVETNRHSYGIVSDRNRLYWLGFKNIVVPIPPRAEQDRIVAFLDEKTAQIDALIAKKQRQIELLDEQKAILINRAVTRGLHPNPDLQDSGIPWIGSIPKGWKVLPFTKYVVDKSDYRGKTPDKVESGVFLVTAKNVRMGHIDYACSKEYVREKDYPKIMGRGLPKIGDILFTTEAPLGNAALVDREEVALAQRIIRFRMHKERFCPQYVLYSMISDHFQWQLRPLATGSTAEGIKASRLPEIRIICPPLSEQLAIAEFIQRMNSALSSARTNIESQIQTLQTLRSTLIAHAVTGKIKV